MDKIRKFEEITHNMLETYKRKNADYGDSFGESVEELGIVSAITRISDKCNRLKSLVKNSAKVSDESMEDTLLDLANYAVMTLIEMNIRKASDVKKDEKEIEKVDVRRFIDLAKNINAEDFRNVKDLKTSVQNLWFKTRSRHEDEHINKLNDHIMACVIVIETYTMTENERFAFMVYLTEKQSQLASMILMDELSID